MSTLSKLRSDITEALADKSAIEALERDGLNPKAVQKVAGSPAFRALRHKLGADRAKDDAAE